MSGSHAVVNVLRWICVFPGSLAAGFLAAVIAKVFYRLSISLGVGDADSLLSRVFLELASGVALGIGGVIAGARIAPSHKVPTVFVVTVVFLLLSGFLLFPALSQRNWWAVLNASACVGGAVSVAWIFYSDESEFENTRNGEVAS